MSSRGMGTNRPHVAIVLLGLLSPLLAACTLFDSKPPPTPKPVGGTLNIAVGPIGPLDPADATGAGLLVLRTACDGITSLDHSSGEPRPGLASSWKVTEGGKSVQLELAGGSKFHDGRSVDARAIAANLSRVARPVTQSIWATLLAPVAGFAEVQSGATGDLSGIKVIDKGTIEISLVVPAADFPATLAHPGLIPISPAVHSTDPEQPAAAICAGPYRIEAAAEAETFKLTRDESYKGTNRGFALVETRADTIVARGFETEDEAFEAYRRGEVDASVLPTPRASEAPEGERATRNTAEVTYLAFDVSKPETPLKFRQAISLAVDRGALIDSSYDGGRRRVLTRWLDEGSPLDSSCSDFAHRLTSDAQGAQKLFVESGGQPGAKLPLIFDSSSIGTLLALSIRVQVKDAIGVDLELQGLDPPAFAQSIRERPVAAVWVASTGPDIPLDRVLLDGLFASDGKHNVFGFKSEEFDALAGKARAAVQFDKRLDLFQQAEESVCTQTPASPLWSGVSQWAANPSKISIDGSEKVDVFGHLLLRHARSKTNPGT